MSKYDPLKTFLSTAHGQTLRLSFREIESILGFPLPASKRYQAWWSNNPWNNVMTKAWLDAGYRTEQVDVANENLVFAPNGGVPPASDRSGSQPPSLFGSMKGTSIVLPGTDLTAPADPEWAKAYE